MADKPTVLNLTRMLVLIDMVNVLADEEDVELCDALAKASIRITDSLWLATDGVAGKCMEGML
jgi:hypothetical protein